MSSAAKSQIDRRVRRQKIFIAVGSVVLLAVVGFELPKVLSKHGNSVSGAVITPAQPGPAGSPPAVAAGALPDTDVVVVVPASSQLVSFGLFKTKDPFVQQLSGSSSGASAAPPSAPPSAPPPPTSTPTPTSTSTTPSTQSPPPGAVVVVPQTAPTATSTPVPGASTSPGTAPTTTTPGVPVTPDALLSTNGVCERVAVNGTFPANQNIFRLVKIAPNGKSVEIGVVGGSFDDGRSTATLKQGDTLTLVNTADGTRYGIALTPKCKVETQPASKASGSALPVAPTPAPSVPPATPTPTTTTTTTAPTATTTTPIVTDSSDPSPPTS